MALWPASMGAGRTLLLRPCVTVTVTRCCYTLILKSRYVRKEQSHEGMGAAYGSGPLFNTTSQARPAACTGGAGADQPAVDRLGLRFPAGDRRHRRPRGCSLRRAIVLPGLGRAGAWPGAL